MESAGEAPGDDTGDDTGDAPGVDGSIEEDVSGVDGITVGIIMGQLPVKLRVPSELNNVYFLLPLYFPYRGIPAVTQNSVKSRHNDQLIATKYS